MFSIICRSETHEQIRKAIDGNMHFESATDAKGSLEKAARVGSTVLILDVDAGSAADIIIGIKKYRVARPETRIILLAPGRVPGDQLIASLVGKGIYDIIAPSLPEQDGGKEFDLTEEVKRVLDKPPATYADAVRWDTGGHGDDQERDREIVYRERLIGTGYIVVAGAGRGAGSTTMSVAVAEYLARKGYKTALVEMNRYPVFWRVRDSFHKNIALFMQTNEFCIQLEKLDDLILKVDGSSSYVVVDLGGSYGPNRAKEDINEADYSVIKWHDYLHEMNRAALPILVLGSAPWQWIDFLPIYTNEKVTDRWHIVTPNGEALKELVKFKNVHRGPVILNPFEREEETNIFFDKLLAPIMPGEDNKKSWLPWRR